MPHTIGATPLFDAQQAHWLETFILALPPSREGYDGRYVWEWAKQNVVDPDATGEITDCKPAADTATMNGRTVSVADGFARLIARATPAMQQKPNTVAAYCHTGDNRLEILPRTTQATSMAVLALTTPITVVVADESGDHEFQIPPGHIYVPPQDRLQTEWLKSAFTTPIVFLYTIPD